MNAVAARQRRDNTSGLAECCVMDKGGCDNWWRGKHPNGTQPFHQQKYTIFGILFY